MLEPGGEIILQFDRPHFIVKLHKTWLEVDLKEGLKKEVESILEWKPALRESLGFLVQTLIPLDVSLADIQSVRHNGKGAVHIVIPHRKDLDIKLTPEEAKIFVPRLQECMGDEKVKLVRELKAGKDAQTAREQALVDYLERPTNRRLE